MNIKATNNFVFILRDEVEDTSNGFWVPGQGREKPSTGKILSSGKKVQDPDIRGGVGRKAVFHKGVGFTLEYEGVEYLVLEGNQIIGVI